MSIPDLKGLLETAQRIQSEVARVREELAQKTVEGETGGGLCRCTVNAINIALTRARELAEADLSRATGGMPLPPGLFGG
jgi:DNA-binding protein YbaB